MRKVYTALLASGLCLAHAGFCDEQDLLALTTNFGPARPASTNPTPEVVAAPAIAPKPASTVAASEPVTTSPATRTLKEESVRRQEAQIVGQQWIGEGLKLYYDAKYEAAIPKFEQALKMLPRADAAEVDYDRAVRGLSDCYERIADAALRAGDKEKAKQLAKKALEYEPSNRAAENIIVKLKVDEHDTAAKAERVALEGKKPKASIEPPNLARTPEFEAKQDEIRKLFREGRILMNSGQYDESEKRYKQVLLIDHYNEDAYKNLQELNSQRLEVATEGSDAIRRQRLWQVTEAWIPTVGGEVKMPEKATGTPIVASASDREKIERKLRAIKFPEVSFREAAISDVVQFLSKESQKYDPEDPKEGVNIVLGPEVARTVGGGAPPAPAPVAPGAEPAVPGAAPAGGGKTITLSLRNVPMDQALKYITSLAGLKYRVEASAVVLLPSDAVEGELVSRPYNVSPDAIKSLLSGATPMQQPQLGPVTPGAAANPVAAAPAPGGAGSTEELKTFFINAGVPFPTGSSLTYFERARTIYVRNTPENLEIFERVLATFNVVPTQVEIEAKFVEINQTDLDELGFQWSLGNMPFANPGRYGLSQIQGGGQNMSPGSAGVTSTTNSITQGLRGANIFGGNAVSSLLVGGSSASSVQDGAASFSGVLNGAQLGLIVNALSQKQSSDVLSAPKVTTISGAQAQIRVVQEFIYPSEFSQPQAGSGGGGTGNSIVIPTPSVPTAFKTREIGVILNVTPTVGADGYTINMTLVPEVSAFLGMLDYSPDVSFGSLGSQTYKIWQPLFETRNLTTSVVIWDGQTVVLGGLIKEEVSKIDDKVPFLGDIPFLGRLFRSKASNRVKRNLLVFVTARLIDPAGNLIHRPDTPGFRIDPMGNAIHGTEPSLMK